jgi:riboflavin kinase / FMN adenylyltransferase
MDVINLEGIVTPFKGNGRQLGYPTANITTATDLADGVYFGYATLGGYTEQPALIFVGVPLTIGDTERRVEVHVLDIPDEDYYEQQLTVAIQYFHRPNQQFDSVPELLTVMAHDEGAGRAWFAKNGNPAHT